MRSVSNNPIIEWTRHVLIPRYKRDGKSFPASVDISSPPELPVTNTLPKTKMIGLFSRLSFALALLAILFCLIDLSEANYKNAPMNGIMFGKRGQTDYDSRGKTFTALCEIATEACQTWFPSQENK